jgi:O-antigen ligase
MGQHKEHRHHRHTKPTKTVTITRQDLSAQVQRIVFYGPFVLLMFGPLAFGAVEPWSIFLLEAGAAALTLLWLAKQWLDNEIDILWNPIFLPMGAFAVLMAVQLVFRISAYPHDTFAVAMLYCAYGMLCFLVTQSMLRSSQARKIAVVFAIYGFLIAAQALLQSVSSNGKLFWLRTPRMGGWIYGSYVNHNHYAGLMELLVPIPLVLALSHLTHEKARIAAGFSAAVMAGTVFLSGSRGGMIAVFTELIVLAILLLRQKRSIRIVIGVGAFAVVLVSLLVWLGGKELTTRVTSISKETRSEISGGMRLSIDRDTLHMFRERPVFGWGAGTFPVVYPQFRTFYTNFFVNEAHNDYLQMLAETGMVGLGITVWFLVVVYRRVRRKIGSWTSNMSAAVTLACALGFTGILVHSLVDFNLQIPANAALFFVFGSIAAAPPLLQKTRRRQPVQNEEEFEEDEIPASEVISPGA